MYKLSFHLVNEDIKFVVKKYVTFTDDDYQQWTWNGNGFIISLGLKKDANVSWEDITSKGYGKTLRFTHRKSGEKGVHLVIRFPQKVLMNLVRQGKSYETTRNFNGFSLSCTIDFESVITDIIKTRLVQSAEHRRRDIAEKKRLSKQRIGYVVYNSKPYQGGGFSGK